MLEWTGERFLPWIEGSQIHYEHIHRYAFASQFVKGKTVIDLASGEGYGTYLLAQKSQNIIGIELDEQTVNHASERYVQDNLKFIKGSILDIPVNSKFDVVVCFEALEHIKEHDKLLSEIKRVLKDDGLLIISTPNKLTYTDEPQFCNEFHLKELYFDDLNSLLNKYFKHVNILGQRIYSGSNIWNIYGGNATSYEEYAIKKDNNEFSFIKRDNKAPVYFVALATNNKTMQYSLTTDSWLIDLSEVLIKDYQKQIGQLTNTLNNKEIQIAEINNTLQGKDNLIIELNTVLQTRDKQIIGLNNELQTKNKEMSELNNTLQTRDKQISKLNSEINTLQIKNNSIENSITWRVAKKFHHIIDKCFPQQSKRRLLLRLFYLMIATPKQFFRNISFKNARNLIYHLKFTNPVLLNRMLTDTLQLNTTIIPEQVIINVPAPAKISALDQVLKFIFPKYTHPLVSIIIPVYNKWQYTYNCLQSILENTSEVDYEVIIADDCSNDETLTMLNKIENIKVISNTTNQGFIKNCNNSAGYAKGKYLLFLNNDTSVQKGWIESMINLAEKDEKIGAVGAKLIYPDGSLQEAGCIVWNDKQNHAWNYGRLCRPDSYQYNYIREVDYCSGSCLLIRKTLFDAIGGFNSEYAPAYSEDCDIAFAIRKLGYKVMYQPKAEIIHYEGVSHGFDPDSPIRNKQKSNQELFYTKWQQTIQTELFPNGSAVFLARDRSRFKKHILFVEEMVPTWDQDAGSQTIYNYLKLFKGLGFKITFFPNNGARLMPYTSELQQLGIEVIYGNCNFNNWIQENGKYFDIVWIARPHIADKYLGIIRKNSNAQILYYVHDLHYLREQRRYELEKRKEILAESKRLRKMEYSIFSKTDVVMTPSDKEAAIIKQEIQNDKVEIIPAYIYGKISDINAIPSFEERHDLLYLGGFRHTPNVDSVLWFIKDIFPKILAQLPDAKLYIVGSEPPEEIKTQQSNNIIVTGYVKELKPYFDMAKVFVSPLRYGAGLKGKIVTSLSYGLPVVTTAIGNEGLNLVDGEEAFIADNPDYFANNVVRIYKDKNIWDRMSKAGIGIIKEKFSDKTARDKMLDIIGYQICSACGSLYKLPIDNKQYNSADTTICHICYSRKC